MGKWQSILMTLAAAIVFMATASCDSVIYDDELDCSTKVKFVFKKHRQALQATNGRVTDVFDSTVGSVHLFVYDAESGELVFDQYATIDQLKSEADLRIGTGKEKCFLPIDLDPGDYRFVAWCGFDDSDHNNAFSLNDATRAAYAYTYTDCSVKISNQTGQPLNEEKYESVYHGVKDATVVLNEPAIIPVELTKDNNDITVLVQHTTETFEPGYYEVVYTDANGTMKFEDNTLATDQPLEYRAYKTTMLTSGMEYNGYPVEAGAMVAHLSTSRLMAANAADARLEVRNIEGRTIFSIPFIQYLLEMQNFTSDGQYYLDCEDTYNCSFYFSGEEDYWIAARIIINNWVRVPDQTGSIGDTGQ